METSEFLFLTKDYILKHKDEEDLFSYYFDEKISLSRKFKNPLRSDTRADCTFHYGTDELIFRDFAKGKVYNVFQFVEEKYGLTYRDALKKIAIDFNIQAPETSADFYLNSIQKKEVAKNKLKKTNKLLDIIVYPVQYTKTHLDYFSTNDYQMTTEVLKRFRTVGIRGYSLVFENYQKDVNANLGFAYFFDKELKYKQVYIPYAEQKDKFRQLISSPIVGIEYLRKDEPVLITKSYKDFQILQLAGFNACCILSENYKLTPQDLMLLMSFGKLYTLFDNDSTGLQASELWHKTYFTNPLLLSVEMKDAYKHYKTFGLEDLKNTLIKQMCS
jgi:hypothetical protein